MAFGKLLPTLCQICLHYFLQENLKRITSVRSQYSADSTFGRLKNVHGAVFVGDKMLCRKLSETEKVYNSKNTLAAFIGFCALRSTFSALRMDMNLAISLIFACVVQNKWREEQHRTRYSVQAMYTRHVPRMYSVR